MKNMIFAILTAITTVGLGPVNAQTYVFKDTPDGDLRATFKGDMVVFDERGPDGMFVKKWHTQFGTVKNGVRTVRSHEGGWITKHMAMIERAKDTGEYVRLMCDQLNLISLMMGCGSASTMWLGMPLDQFCIGRNSRFWLHSTTGYGTADNPKSMVSHPGWNAYYAKNYLPPAVARMFYAKGWDKYTGLQVGWITGAEMKARVPTIQYCSDG